MKSSSTATALIALLFSTSAILAQDRDSARQSPSVQHAESLSAAFRNASETVLPTVVKIRSETKARRVVQDRQDGFGTSIEDFFGGFQMYVPPSAGTGSGVIIDSDGTILTNNHVIANADEVTVELQDGREFRAIDIRTDPATDLAVIRIKPDSKLPYARMGNSDRLRIGDWVLAIGNPFEFEASVSAGIISGKGRSLNSSQRTTYLQTDAAINPGNSGGPLVNLRGEVVGINTAIASKTGAFNGIGFAIPVNLAKWVSTQLVKDGRVRRAWLGVGIRPVTHQIRSALDLTRQTKGVLIGEVRHGAPSERGGILPGDVIVSVGGQPIGSSPELQRVVEQSPLGSTIRVDVIRNGKPTSVRIRTETLPPAEKRITRRRIMQLPPSQIEIPDLGIRLFQVDESEAKRRGLKSESGMMITEAAKQVAELGLRRGSIIYQIGDKKIQDQVDLERALEQHSDGLWKIYIENPEHSNQIVFFPVQ